MNNYRLVGNFDFEEFQEIAEQNNIEIQVPFLDSNALRYGIGNSLKKLQSSGIFPTEDGIDILCLAGLIYLADTRISRSLHSQDSWTREISISLPVYNIEKWIGSTETFARMLNFLTGDRWSISFEKREKPLSKRSNKESEYVPFDSVTLFSGGMDSLIEVINSLEQKKKVALISHAGDGYTKNTQSSLLKSFVAKYPDISPSYFDLWMVFEKDIIPGGEIENSTRSRSFLFIAFGIFALSGMDNLSTLQVPENGLIALNVPLDELRVGSHSTRTTHPFYMELWNKVLNDLEMGLSVQNPYWNKTKGEMASECLNPEFLLDNIKNSTSCSSPQKARWSGSAPQHCGYCVPCLIRRAAIAKAFGIKNDPTPYTAEHVSQIISEHAQGTGVQLRSFQIAIDRIKSSPTYSKMLIHKSGPLHGSSEYLQQLSEVYTKGLIEVDAFIQMTLSNEK